MSRAVVTGLAALGACAFAAVTAAEDLPLPDISRATLDNGAVVIMSVKREVPLVAIEVELRGGAVVEPAAMPGLAALTAGLLDKGAGERDAAAFAGAVATAGGRLQASGGLESISISAEFLSRDTDVMIGLLADMLMRPRLAEADFEELRARAIDFIRAAKDSDVAALLPLYGRALLFGDHPYGRPVPGSETSLERIRHADVLRYYEEQVGADRLVLSVSGDFDADAMLAALTEAFGAWRPASGTFPEVPSPAPVSGRRVLLVDKPGMSQTWFWLGNAGVAIDYPQRAELDIANTLFGGRFTSILNTALRVESGLTYGVTSGFTRARQGGWFAIVSFTETASTGEALDMTLDLLGRYRERGIDRESLHSARNYILGQYPLRFETAAQLAGAFAALELYGLGVDYYAAYGTQVTAARQKGVEGVIRDAFPRPDDLAIVLVGDADRIRDVAAGYGPVTEMPITEARFAAPGQRSK